MCRSGPLFAAVVLVVAVCVVPVQATQFFCDFWGASANGSMRLAGGYSIDIRGPVGAFTSKYNNMYYMGFNGLSDGADKIPPGKTGDLNDGAALANWLVGKKAFNAILYFCDKNQFCDPLWPPGSYLSEPVVVLGFRCSNVGQFIDHSSAPTFLGNIYGTYDIPWVGSGDMAPPAWRMGQLPYRFKGDIGTGGEFYQFSVKDTQYANQPARWWNAQYAAWSGFSGSAFSFGWLVTSSDAHLPNSTTIGSADCSGEYGGDEPRDLAWDWVWGWGWYAKKIDRGIINGLGYDPELKGLVFQSINSPYAEYEEWGAFFLYGREDGDGEYEGIYAPYLAIYATLAGDVTNDGCVNVVDLLTLASSFGSKIPEIGFDPEADLNCDAKENVIDLLILAEQFGTPCL